MRVANFRKDLDYSHALADLPIWKPLFREWFPDFLDVQFHNADGPGQRAGWDCTVLTKSGHVVCEIKHRLKDFSDILLEYVSNERTGAPGWVCNPGLHCGYVVYAILPLGRAWLLPRRQLQVAWERNSKTWLAKAERHEEGFHIASAQNRGYKTLSLALPADVLLSAMSFASFPPQRV